jgi:hypothetical protein
VDICSIKGCNNGRKYANGWCSTHYIRWWKYGDVTFTKRDTSPRRVPVNPVDLAYLAGLIDGEGYIGTSCSYKDSSYITLKVTMCDKEVIDWMVATLGGGIYIKNPSQSHHRIGYTWSSSNKNYLRELLGAVLPYMKLESKRNLIHDFLLS